MGDIGEKKHERMMHMMVGRPSAVDPALRSHILIRNHKMKVAFSAYEYVCILESDRDEQYELEKHHAKAAERPKKNIVCICIARHLIIFGEL